MTTTAILVKGMTCGHCVGAVTSELTALPGVRDVSVELQPGEVSKVTIVSDDPVAEAVLAAAVGEAGYELVPAAS